MAEEPAELPAVPELRPPAPLLEAETPPPEQLQPQAVPAPWPQFEPQFEQEQQAPKRSEQG